MKKRVLFSVLIVLFFIIAFFGKKILSSFVPITFSSTILRVSYNYFWWIFPTLLIVVLLFGFKNLLENLGLNKSLKVGFLFAIITVSPMLISSGIIGNIDSNLDYSDLFLKTFCAGFFEEYLFRGFLFGILFRKLNWGFIPAALLGGIIFGLAHIYQGSTSSEAIGVFVVTSIGSIWFAWLYIEWNSNLWVPIFLHMFMNLSWSLFDMSDNALGGTYTNVFRLITIALTIIITIRYNKQRGLIINRKNLITNNN